MTVTPPPAASDWYAQLLERIEPFLTEEERFEMEHFSEYFREGILAARMKREKIFDHIEGFVFWLKRKLLWSKEHNALFFRKISRIL